MNHEIVDSPIDTDRVIARVATPKAGTTVCAASRFALGILSVGVVATSCSASIVTSSDKLGGVQDGPRWGIVKYLNQGADAVIDARAADARKQMQKFCAPIQYRVTATSERDSSFFLLLEGTGGGGSSSYLYIRFECVEQSPAESSVPKSRQT
jgi:hypothetical protein